MHLLEGEKPIEQTLDISHCSGFDNLNILNLT